MGGARSRGKPPPERREMPKDLPKDLLEWEGLKKVPFPLADAVLDRREERLLATYDVIHPSRKLAIAILERISEVIGNEKAFDKKWFACEDAIVEILIERKEKK